MEDTTQSIAPTTKNPVNNGAASLPIAGTASPIADIGRLGKTPYQNAITHDFAPDDARRLYRGGNRLGAANRYSDRRLFLVDLKATYQVRVAPASTMWAVPLLRFEEMSA